MQLLFIVSNQPSPIFLLLLRLLTYTEYDIIYIMAMILVMSVLLQPILVYCQGSLINWKLPLLENDFTHWFALDWSLHNIKVIITDCYFICINYLY